jgi:hypothetical protein
MIILLEPSVNNTEIACHCLLDLCAAFDTIDHSLLVERLSSWFDISGYTLNWIIFYHSSRYFDGKITNSQSSVFQLLYGVPQGSVHHFMDLLDSLFILLLLILLYLNVMFLIIFMEMTLSSLFFLLPQNFSETLLFLKIPLLKSVLAWMSANLVCKPLKTDFLLIGLPKRLSKLNNLTVNVTSDVTLSPITWARNLGVLFHSNLSLSGHISSVTISCLSNIRDLRRIRLNIDQNTALNIATVLVHSKLDYCNSLLLKLSANQLEHIQLVLNSAARAVAKTSRFHILIPIPINLPTSSKFRNVYIVRFYLSHIKCIFSNKPT